jgi:uncharacterized membrane protein YccC
MLARLRAWIGWTDAKPDIARGLRAATCTIAPLVAADLLHRPELTTVALGGWLGALADTGGAYRTRAWSVGAFSVGGALASFVGTLAGRSIVTAVAAMAAWAFATSLLGVLGARGRTLATLYCVTFAVALARPGDLHVAGAMAARIFSGGALAMLLALLFWPLHPHEPVRRAVAAVYRKLGKVGAAGAVLVAEGAGATDPRWQTDVRKTYRTVRDALEQARAEAGAVRSRRPGSSAHGDALRVLIEGADQLFGAIIAALDEVEAAGRAEPSVAAALGQLNRLFDAIADAVERHTAFDAVAASEDLAAPPPSLRLAVTFVRAAQDALDVLSGDRGTLSGPIAAVAEPAARPAVSELLETNAMSIHHGVRVAIASAIAVLLTSWLPVGHGYWLTLTVITVLQPSVGLTRGRGLQRAVGTMLGGVAAALLGLVTHEPLAKLVWMFPLSVLAVAIRPLSYGLFTLFLTPVFLLLSGGDGGWELAGLRILHTTLGAALAFLAASALWPSWESGRLRRALVDVILAGEAYLAAIEASWPAGERSAPALQARRRMGIVINEAEAALERSIGQPSMNAARVDAAQTLITYARRLAGAVAALAATPVPSGSGRLDETTRARLERARRGLLDAASEPAGEAPPPPSPSPAEPADLRGDGAAALGRIERCVRVLETAAARFR